ncbi:hypothetical protein LWC34_30065 [Kibdelosporangium philippinense]|uniref:Uncharacterized protein n=2 Tax=Kibdelosporangium philippinense TaxID=211113 RepID=A0ABS8ZI42_9PSEU|nr:hypothetical protein [Kibdelosporangium philippinense]MCE7007044.1 hypothetical protein [Kibdelosporangium philippinense]
MTTSVWVTIMVGVLSAVLSSTTTLAGQWMAIVRQVKLAHVERDARRDERGEQRREDDRKRREECYATFLVAARTLRDASVRASATSADIGSLVAALREAASIIELRAPKVADESLPAVMERAERLTTVRLNGAASQVVMDAVDSFDQRVVTVRQAMRADIASVDS